MKKLTLVVVTALSILGSYAQKKKNVLFIAVDDLKPLINEYGQNQMKTPNFDRLIKSGVMFQNAEVQQAVCGPSRASVMTGTYPDRTKVWDLHTDFRQSAPNFASMPEYLITQGYETTAIGKIYHKGSTSPGHDGKSWSIPHVQPENFDPKYGEPAFGYYQDPAIKVKMKELMAEAEAQGMKTGQQRNYAFKKLKPSTECVDVSDEAYQDGIYTVEALKKLQMLAKGDKPFFLGLGYQRPHLPFVAPKKYWDLYDRNSIKISDIQELAKGAPRYAYHDSGELKAFSDIGNTFELGTALPVEKQKELIHGYMASVSYIDAQLGKVLDELERLKLTENTVIVLWGDHGYHLGDHTVWNKHSNLEQAVHIPFIFSGPGVAKNQKVSTPVELVDLFPTLFDLISVKQNPQTDGKSLYALLDNDSKTTIKDDFALSQYPRQKDKMGYTIRTEKYRYTEWHGNSYNTEKPYDKSNVVAVELYDMTKDPNESTNVAKSSEYQSIAKEMQQKMEYKLNAINKRNIYKAPPKEENHEPHKEGTKKAGGKKNKKGGKKAEKSIED